MAKHIDLSGLKKQPLKKKETPKIEEVVSAIHKEAIPMDESSDLEKEPVKRITLDLPASLHTKLKMRAVQEQITIRSFVIDILEQILD